jgi:signal transduction histidine kinase
MNPTTSSQHHEVVSELLDQLPAELVGRVESALEAEERLQRIEVLISDVAHHLRGPLHAMNLRLELLKSEESAADRHLEKLRKEIYRVDRAVDALLRFSRCRNGEVTEFPIGTLIHELGAATRNRKIMVVYDVPEPSPSIRADSNLVREALSQLITNAVDSMEAAGGVLTLGAGTESGFVLVKVSDTGPGIDSDHLPLIFKHHYTTKQDRAGMGLPLAQHALQLSKAELELSSQPGQGTTCLIRFRAP